MQKVLQIVNKLNRWSLQGAVGCFRKGKSAIGTKTCCYDKQLGTLGKMCLCKNGLWNAHRGHGIRVKISDKGALMMWSVS